MNIDEIELVRLAIELARLRRKTEPAKFLNEAARLLTEARTALYWEQSRPEREQREQLDQLSQHFAQGFRERQVPFEKMCRPATENEKFGASDLRADESFSYTNGEDNEIRFEWRVFRGEREFKECLERHAERIYQEVKQRLDSIARDKADWGQVAVNILGFNYWLPDEWREKFISVKNSEECAAHRGGGRGAANQLAGVHSEQAGGLCSHRCL